MSIIKLGQPTLQFPLDFDERMEWEVEQKGWFEGASLTFPNGLNIPLSFWDPVRLAQDLETAVDNGASCLAEPFLIVVPSVKRSSMQKAVQELMSSGYFATVLDIANGPRMGPGDHNP